MKQRWGLDRNNVLRPHLEIPGVSNNTTGTLEQKKKTNSSMIHLSHSLSSWCLFIPHWRSDVDRYSYPVYNSFYGLVLDLAMYCGLLLWLRWFFCLFVRFTTAENYRYGYRFSSNAISSTSDNMNIANIFKVTICPLRLHAASSVQSPRSISRFNSLLPTVNVTALKLHPLCPSINMEHLIIFPVIAWEVDFHQWSLLFFENTTILIKWM